MTLGEARHLGVQPRGDEVRPGLCEGTVEVLQISGCTELLDGRHQYSCLHERHVSPTIVVHGAAATRYAILRIATAPEDIAPSCRLSPTAGECGHAPAMRPSPHRRSDGAP